VSVVFAAIVSLAASTRATETAFWTLYEADSYTYSLFLFDGPTPLGAAGKVACAAGKLLGSAKLDVQGRFGGASQLDGAGYAEFPTSPFEPRALCFDEANRSVSIEAWIKLDRYSPSGAAIPIVSRPDHNGTAIGFSLFVDPGGR
jgi:hypothetical protein